ncbi:hypothetical protein [Hydrococcus rivularis]|nr:hypothetical protein [Hydrococcus rivularis]
MSFGEVDPTSAKNSPDPSSHMAWHKFSRAIERECDPKENL